MGPIARARAWCHPRAVDEVTRQRVGSALRRMGEDLVAERRQVMLLTRENQRLRDEVEQLRVALAARQDGRVGPKATPRGVGPKATPGSAAELVSK
jgi:hypothetical protein